MLHILKISCSFACSPAGRLCSAATTQPQRCPRGHYVGTGRILIYLRCDFIAQITHLAASCRCSALVAALRPSRAERALSQTLRVSLLPKDVHDAPEAFSVYWVRFNLFRALRDGLEPNQARQLVNARAQPIVGTTAKKAVPPARRGHVVRADIVLSRRPAIAFRCTCPHKRHVTRAAHFWQRRGHSTQMLAG
jgi:hypothetical protein